MSRQFVIIPAMKDLAPARLHRVLSRLQLQFALGNDLGLIYALIIHLRERLAAFGLCDEMESVRAGIALEEALLNAMYHGNLELTSAQLEQASVELMTHGRSSLVVARQQTARFRDRRIHVQAELSRRQAEFVVRDEGPGFDAAAHLPLVVDDDPRRRTGRGLELMHAFMDEVRFNERGNEVTLIKRSAAA